MPRLEGICLERTAGGGAGWFYEHYDGLGSVVAISDVNGNVVEKYSYDVFGEATIRDANDDIRTTSAYGNSRMFTGREFDSETGLYYYRARYYNPAIGRFLQADPVAMYMQFLSTKSPASPEDGDIPGIYLSSRVVEEFLLTDSFGEFLRNDPAGRFLQDVSFDYSIELNLYTYVRNNPIIYTDLFGLSSSCGKDPCGGRRGAKAYYKCYFRCLIWPGGAIHGGLHLAGHITKRAALKALGWGVLAIDSIHCTHKCAKKCL